MPAKSVPKFYYITHLCEMEQNRKFNFFSFFNNLTIFCNLNLMGAQNIRSLVGNVKVQELAKQKPKFSCHKKKFSFRGLTVGCLAEVWQMMSSRGRTVVQPSVARLDSQTEARHLPDQGQTVRPRNGFLRGHGERLRFFQFLDLLLSVPRISFPIQCSLDLLQEGQRSMTSRVQ